MHSPMAAPSQQRIASQLNSTNPEVRAALALGTQAVQEVRAQAVENQRKAVAEALAAERASWAETQKAREAQIINRLSEVAEREQAAAIAQAIKETEERCAQEASSWMMKRLPNLQFSFQASAPTAAASSQRTLCQMAADKIYIELLKSELLLSENQLIDSAAASDSARKAAVQHAVEATLRECETTTVELIQKIHADAEAETAYAVQQAREEEAKLAETRCKAESRRQREEVFAELEEKIKASVEEETRRAKDDLREAAQLIQALTRQVEQQRQLLESHGLATEDKADHHLDRPQTQTTATTSQPDQAHESSASAPCPQDCLREQAQRFSASHLEMD
ncbi:hypothetical protein AB1Y20_022207 [Prymnesium parvum]|uniref:Uncharacterized protein n=1 Tax=Prymnesium parvum TaxID=97485 RepID=A0AB34JI42_PRYPA|mmetsp:Transcript_8687/g.21445  ORF Transcript_8687/g.21445 Transcript_8687/m.21445 type:complete len:338 (+) Transcript_8687:25-1038(+)